MEPAAAHILIVDDSPEDRQTFRRFLTRQASGAYTITEAGRGDHALAALQTTRPDCVLLDERRPDMDGLALLAAIRAQSDVPVVLLTGVGSAVLACVWAAPVWLRRPIWSAPTCGPTGGPGRRMSWSAFEDITERKRAEAALAAHTAALSRTSAKGITEMMEEELYGPITDRQRQALAKLTRSARHLRCMVAASAWRGPAPTSPSQPACAQGRYA